MIRLTFVGYFILSFQFSFAQRIEEIIVEPDTAGRTITYGSTIYFKFFTVNKKGKKKEVEYRKVDNRIACESLTPECTIANGKMSFSPSSNSKGFVKGNIRFYSIKTDDIKLDKTFEIKMNFKDPLVLNYDGKKGLAGINGNNGGIPLLFRDGKAGDQGGNGGEGWEGKKITVRIKKEYDEFFKKEIYFVYVTDDTTHEESIFRCLNPEKGLEINVRGGDGGQGGKGGSGSNGKAGVEGKSAGDGGNGGYAGNGGIGGRGGKVVVIAHTNASEILGYLKMNNLEAELESVK